MPDILLVTLTTLMAVHVLIAGIDTMAATGMMFALLDKIVTIGHNSCNNCNARNGCIGHIVYCVLLYWI